MPTSLLWGGLSMFKFKFGAWNDCFGHPYQSGGGAEKRAKSPLFKAILRHFTGTSPPRWYYPTNRGENGLILGYFKPYKGHSEIPPRYPQNHYKSPIWGTYRHPIS